MHDDYFDTFAKHVDIFGDEIDSLEEGQINLKSGDSISTDALVLGTGWAFSFGYLDESLRARLGLPYPINANVAVDPGSVQPSEWEALEQAARPTVLSELPILADPPKMNRVIPKETPFRLHNLIAPVDDPTHSILCIGQVLTTNLFQTTEVQSIWATAYFDGHIQLPPLQERKARIAKFIAWNRLRYLRLATGSNISFDHLEYIGGLLQELGLASHLKNKGWFAYWFKPVHATDLAGLTDEYKSKYCKKVKDD